MTHPSRKRKKNYNNKNSSSNKAHMASYPDTNNKATRNTRKPAKKGLSAERDASRMYKGAIGTNAIDAIQKWAIQLKPYELRYPCNIDTFHEMYSRDDAVGGVLNATYALVENAFSNWNIRADNTNDNSIATAQLLRHIFSNMNESTMRTVARNAATFNQFGFSILEKDYRKLGDGEYQGDLPKGVKYEDIWGIDRLRMIPQRSLDHGEPFVIGNEGRDILSCRQNAVWFQNSSHALMSWQPAAETVEIPRNKFLLMGMNITDSTPMGVSPLEQVWTSWKEKLFFENYMSVGVSKDMAGMPLLEIPEDILNKAAVDPDSPEAKLVDQMAKDVASMHAGEQNMMIIPSDPFNEGGSGNTKAYNLKFLGIEGGGKQNNLQEAINKRKEAIYQSFGALNLISNESKGGYNQLEGQNSIHLYFVNRVIKIITEAINKDLIPQILKLSGISLPTDSIPKFEAGEIEPVSLEEVSKMIQRVKSVNGLALTKENIIDYHKKIGFDTEHMENMSQEELFKLIEMGSKGDSRSGEGNGTSGTGDSQNVTGGDDNMDNTA